MYFAKQIDENGELIALHSMDRPFAESTDFVPVTAEEYMMLLAEMEANMPQPEPTDQISDSEALAIITGGAV